MAVGDGTTWDESTPTDGTLAVQIDDYNRDVRKGVRNRMALEHEWPASQSATSEGGRHQFVTFQQQGATPTMAGTQLGTVYLDTNGACVFASSGGSALVLQNAAGTYKPVGSIVQVVNVESATATACNTNIRFDDTLPQITEGVEAMTLAIIPKASTNKILVEVVVNAGPGTSLNGWAAVLFNTDVHATNGIALGCASGDNAKSETVSFKKYYTASDLNNTTATTFRVRVGGNSTNVTLNGNGSGVRMFGGASVSSITITEIAA